jgi:hypothetical protein
MVRLWTQLTFCKYLKLAKYHILFSYIVTLFNVRFIQHSILLRVWFGQVSLYNENNNVSLLIVPFVYLGKIISRQLDQR